MTITTGGTQTASLSAEGNFRFATNIVDSSVSIIDVESQDGLGRRSAEWHWARRIRPRRR